MRFTDQEFANVKKLLVIYQWAQDTLMTKLNIIHQDFKNFHDNNPIEYITGRIKSPESIGDKLYKMELPLTAAHAQKALKDMAGIRIICPFAKDIYQLVALLHTVQGLEITQEKDYVSHPKPSGYRSYHLIVSVPVFFAGCTQHIPVEVQIRTEAMNFWATLEHQAKYKYKEQVPKHLSDELVKCADQIAELDDRMFLIYEILQLINSET